jgi:hypothetical protein
MNTNDDDLLAALRRAEDPADRRLAELLASAPGKEGCAPHGKEGCTPRASDALAAFLAAAVSGVSPLPDTDDQPVAARDKYTLEPVHLARPPQRSSAMKPVLAFSRVLKLSLLSKIVLGATLAIGSVGAVASTTPLGNSGDDVVIAAPATDGDEDGDDSTEAIDENEHASQVALAEERAANEAAAAAAKAAAKKAAKAAAKKAAAAAGDQNNTNDGDQDDSDEGDQDDSDDGDQNDADDGDQNDSDDGDQDDSDDGDQHESDDDSEGSDD